MFFQWFPKLPPEQPEPLPVTQKWFQGELGREVTISCDPIPLDSLIDKAYGLIHKNTGFARFEIGKNQPMLNKTFSVRSNAIRNARGQLGKGAQQGVHFHVGGAKGAYTWTPASDAPPVDTAHAADSAIAASDSPILGDIGPAITHTARKIKVPGAKRDVIVVRPKAKRSVKKTGRKAGRKQITSVAAVSGKRKRMFSLISSTKGASLATLCNALGWQKHTVRGAVSTIASQFGVKIKSIKDARRGRVYQVAGRSAVAA